MTEALKSKKAPKFNLTRALIVLFFLVVLVVIGFFVADRYFGYNYFDNLSYQKMATLEIKKEGLDQETIESYQRVFAENSETFLNAPTEVSSVQSINKMGLVKRLAGDYQGALDLFMHAYSLSPDSGIIVGNIAEIYHYQLNDFAKAEEWYQRGIENRTAVNRLDLVTNYADLIVRDLGSPIEARDEILGLTEIYKNSTTLNLKVAEYFENINEIDLAVQYYTSALQLNPDSEKAQQGLQRLQ